MPQKRIGPVANSQNIEAGDTGPHTVGTHVIHVSGTWTGSIRTRGYLKGNGLDANNREDLAYKPLKTGVLTDPSVTQITANGIYEVVTDSLQLVLDIVVATGTGPVIDIQPLRG